MEALAGLKQMVERARNTQPPPTISKVAPPSPTQECTVALATEYPPTPVAIMSVGAITIVRGLPRGHRRSSHLPDRFTFDHRVIDGETGLYS